MHGQKNIKLDNTQNIFSWIKNQVSRTNHHYLLIDSLIDLSISM